MSAAHSVGGHPEGSGSEEAHRPTPSHSEPPRLLRLTASRRFRLQSSGLTVVVLVLSLFYLLPQRTVRIMVDGDVAAVHSRIHNNEALVGRAGVELGPGDRIEERGDDELLVDRATEAVFNVDGRAYSLRTQAATIDELLQETGVALNPGDSVLRDHDFVSPRASIEMPAPPLVATASGKGFVSSADPAPVTIEVRRAVPFSVIENGQGLELRSSRETIATALRDVGVRLGPGDLIQPPPDTELTAGLQVRLQHASEVVLTLPEGKSILYTLDATLGEAMAHSGVPLPVDYRLDPPAGTLVSAGMAVHVIAVSEEQAIETERIGSETVYEPDLSLPYGEHRVVQGQDGAHYRRYSIVSEDGQVVSRDLVEEWDDPAVANTVIYYSTADAPPPPAPDDAQVASVLRVYATWYNPASSGRPPSDPSYGLTATGVPVTQGIVAVDPSVIPLGTRLFIPGYGYAVAADTGGGIRGDMIDLGYPDGVVPDWISQWVDIYILE